MSTTQSNMTNYKSEAKELNVNFLQLTSLEEDILKDKVPFEAKLVSMDIIEGQCSDMVIYKRLWKLPICITILGIMFLAGNNWLSKIEKLYFECALPIPYILACEIINANTIKLHFRNKLVADRMKHLLKQYVDKHCIYKIDIM